LVNPVVVVTGPRNVSFKVSFTVSDSPLPLVVISLNA
jgi:hypothetical protein